MLRFFSKIRYQLAAENRTVKYLRYAIGEILLVVIGILIALQVNNWNELKKEHSLEQNYLKRLKVDLEKDNERLLFSNDLCDIRMNQINELSGAIQNPDSEFVNYNKIVESIEKVTWKSYLPLSRIVYDELQNTGRMDLIEKESIREELANYYVLAKYWESILQTLEYQKEFAHATLGLLDKNMLAAIEAAEPLEMKEAVDHSILQLKFKKAHQIIRELSNNRDAIRCLPQIYHYHALSKEVVGLLLEKNKLLMNTIQNEIKK